MNAKQRKAKTKRAADHVAGQSSRKQVAVKRSVGKSGKPLKARMERRGYVPNGRGGWRRLAKPDLPEDTLDKD